MITPTIGRIVWFRPADQHHTEQPQAAIVTYVWSDNLVSLCTFAANGTWSPRGSIPLWQGEGARPQGYDYAEWMPYQKGQAAKAEAAEAALKAK